MNEKHCELCGEIISPENASSQDYADWICKACEEGVVKRRIIFDCADVSKSEDLQRLKHGVMYWGSEEMLKNKILKAKSIIILNASSLVFMQIIMMIGLFLISTYSPWNSFIVGLVALGILILRRSTFQKQMRQICLNDFEIVEGTLVRTRTSALSAHIEFEIKEYELVLQGDTRLLLQSMNKHVQVLIDHKYHIIIDSREVLFDNQVNEVNI